MSTHPYRKHFCNRHKEQRIMGKYFIAWLLGVPAFVLVLFYLFCR